MKSLLRRGLLHHRRALLSSSSPPETAGANCHRSFLMALSPVQLLLPRRLLATTNTNTTNMMLGVPAAAVPTTTTWKETEVFWDGTRKRARRRRKENSNKMKKMKTTIAIVGAGPSGCYAAKYLKAGFQKAFLASGDGDGTSDDTNDANHVSIDLLDKLPTLGGLVRYGVAPDHPEVKNVLRDFEALFFERPAEEEKEEENDKGVSTRRSGRDKNPKTGAVNVRFYGNVRLGRDVHLDELRSLYDAVVLAYGCESSRLLGIPGETDLEGVISAREFVAWYNGHPEYGHVGDAVRKALRLLPVQPPASPGGAVAAKSDDEEIKLEGDDNDEIMLSHGATSAVVIGHGNVALDCARILAKGGFGLRQEETDAARPAVEVLGAGLSRISVVGRRGHLQAAFTIKEVRELVHLSTKDRKQQQRHGETSLLVRALELDMGSATEASRQELEGSRPRQRIDKLLRDVAAAATQQDMLNRSDSSNSNSYKEHASPDKQVSLRFLLNPVRFESDDVGVDNRRRLSRVICERTRLVGDRPGHQRAEGTGEFEEFPARLAIVSVGYKAEPVPGLENFFDSKSGTVRHFRGKVDDSAGGASFHKGALYVTGWLKRGPTGIIGTNIADAKETVGSVLTDLAAGSEGESAFEREGTTTASISGPSDGEGGEGQEEDAEEAEMTDAEEEEETLESLLTSRGVQYVDWEGYQKIVRQEWLERRSPGQPREKITSLERMLEVAGS